VEHVRIDERPSLRDPALIVTFAGWNDAAEVATTAARQIVRQLDGRRFATLDAEEFFVFTETRPTVKIVGGNQRQIDWPATEMFAVANPSGARDFLVLVGTEPQLRWRTFTNAILDVCADLGVKLIVSLGGLLADVPHTVPPKLSGSATDPGLLRRLRSLQVFGSRYEGPTGILGVLSATARERGMESASIWGNVPHYISSTFNPRVALSILRQVSQLLDLPLSFEDLERQADTFDAEVSEVVSHNPEVAEYVRQLEQRQGRRRRRSTEAAPPGELPSGEQLIQDVEAFLKRQPPAESEDEEAGDEEGDDEEPEK
jgi:proteasome assembly chaperone (PAC2) family protein